MTPMQHTVALALGQIPLPASSRPRPYVKPPKPVPAPRYPAPESEVNKYGAQIEALRLEGYTHAAIEDRLGVNATASILSRYRRLKKDKP